MTVPWQSDLVEMAEDPKENIIMENHEFGMPPTHYVDWPMLNATYTILSTTRDRHAAAALRSPCSLRRYLLPA